MNRQMWTNQSMRNLSLNQVILNRQMWSNQSMRNLSIHQVIINRQMWSNQSARNLSLNWVIMNRQMWTNQSMRNLSLNQVILNRQMWSNQSTRNLILNQVKLNLLWSYMIQPCLNGHRIPTNSKLSSLKLLSGSKDATIGKIFTQLMIKIRLSCSLRHTDTIRMKKRFCNIFQLFCARLAKKI